MKRLMTILLIFLLMLSSLSAASYIDKIYKDLNKQGENVNIGFSISLSSLVAADIGFSPEAITSMVQLNEKPVVSKAMDVLDPDTGTFSIATEDEFFMYWKVLGNPSNLPKIFIKVSGPLVNVHTGDTVHWKASWADVNGAYNGTDVVLSGQSAEMQRKQVFPDASISTDSNNLTSYCICKKVKLETLEPYWENPAVAYSANLWLEVQGL